MARVAIVSQYPPEEGRMSSGVEGVVSALADGLASVGLDVHVVTCVRGLKRVRSQSTPAGTTVHRIPSFGRLAWLIGFPIEKARIHLLLNSIKPDLVHVHTQTLYAEAALERGWPSVLTIHGVYRREAALMSGWRRFQATLLTRFERDALRRAKNVIIINEYLQHELARELNGKNVRLIENPIDNRYFDVSSAEEPGRILYAGTIIHRKDLMSLLEAVAIIASKGKPISLRVAGSQTIEPHYYARCSRYVIENGLQDSVNFLGVIGTEQFLHELARANTLVLPSLQETAPMVVSEAMAAGKPIVATPAGGTAGMVGHSDAGLIVPFRNPEALADAIEKLLDDVELRRQMGLRARQKAEQRHRLSAVVSRTIAFYEEVLGKHS